MVAVSVATWTAKDLTLALGGKWNGKSGKVKCPLHDDRTPSMSITAGSKQEIVVHCFVCDQAAIVEHLRSRNLLPPKDNRPWTPPTLIVSNGHVDDDDMPNFPVIEPTPLRKEICTYSYYNADGTLAFEKKRYEWNEDGEVKKTFRIRNADGLWELGDTQPVVYRFPELLQAPQDALVWLPEGEKDVDRLRTLGWVATTNFDGASGLYRESYNEAFRGRHVVIIPDNDDAGEKHAETYRAALTGVAASVRVIHLSGIPEKGDVSDWLDAGGTPDQLLLIAQEAFPYRFRLRTPDDIENMPPPAYMANDWLVQGTLSELYGPSGVGKSFVVLDLVYSVASGSEWLGCIPVVQGTVIYIAAEGVGGLQKRQRAWKAKHPNADISSVRYITVPVNMLESPEVDDLMNSIRGQCADKPMLVVIDTLARSMAGGDENSTRDMNAVVAAADRVRMSLECHVLIVHHTGKDGEHDRGSSALRGGCDTMIKISRDDSAIVMHCDKQKEAAEPADLTLKLVPVESVDSCVMEVFDQTGQMTNAARRLLFVLADSFPLAEGASTTAWMKASGMPDQSFYRARNILVQNGCVVKDSKFSPNLITREGCKDIDIEPVPTTPDRNYQELPETTIGSFEVGTTTTTKNPPVRGFGSGSSNGWWGDRD